MLRKPTGSIGVAAMLAVAALWTGPGTVQAQATDTVQLAARPSACPEFVVVSNPSGKQNGLRGLHAEANICGMSKDKGLRVRYQIGSTVQVEGQSDICWGGETACFFNDTAGDPGQKGQAKTLFLVGTQAQFNQLAALGHKASRAQLNATGVQVKASPPFSLDNP